MPIKTISVVLLALALHATPARAQPNSLYLEHMGNGGIVSLNYERDVAPRLALRLGAGLLPVSLDTNDSDHYLFPVMVNYRVGGGDLQEELGIGALFDRPARGTLPPEVRFARLDVTPTVTLGMRYAPQYSRLLLRAGFTPLTIRGEVLPSYGASVGFRF